MKTSVFTSVPSRSDASLYPVRERISTAVLDRLCENPDMRDAELKRVIARTAAGEMAGMQLPFSDQQRLVEQLFNAMRGFDILQPLMDNPAVTEIMVNGPYQVFYEKEGILYTSDLRFEDTDHLNNLIAHLFSRGNRTVSHAAPIADVRLPDGSRANAVLDAIAPDGPVLTIRKFTGIAYRMEELVAAGTLQETQANALDRAVVDRKNILICGGTGVGKTTFLNILSACIPAAERVVTIEDSAELSLQGLPNLVRLEVKTAGPDGTGEIGMSRLVRTALRLRPDRLILGEVRGSEATDLLQALNTGHRGSLCTGHANSCRDMLHRLAMLAQMSSGIPYSALLRQIGMVIDIVIHMERQPDGRRVVDDIRSVETDPEEGFRLTSFDTDREKI